MLPAKNLPPRCSLMQIEGYKLLPGKPRLSRTVLCYSEKAVSPPTSPIRKRQTAFTLGINCKPIWDHSFSSADKSVSGSNSFSALPTAEIQQMCPTTAHVPFLGFVSHPARRNNLFLQEILVCTGCKGTTL